MIAPFMMGTTSSTTMQTLGQINQRSPAVGVKIWCLCVFFTCRITRKHETADIKFIQEAENQSASSHAGRLVAPIDVQFGMADGHEGPLG